MSHVPAYLADDADAYDKDPRAAAMRWFGQAKYGRSSLLGRHEWGQFREPIRPADDARLAHPLDARHNPCNRRMNVAPLPEGSFPDQACDVLRSVGQRLESEGFPGE